MAFDLDDQELEYTRRLHAERKLNMVLPKKEKKVTLKDVSLGTAYDINKNLVKKYEKELTEEQIIEKEKMMFDYFKEKNNQYYMMLCHERRDYTIFNFYAKAIAGPRFPDIIECLTNRGTIVGIDRTEDKVAIEIWLMIDDEAYCYYLFPYDEGVVKVF